jgi:hypothetical protein
MKEVAVVEVVNEGGDSEDVAEGDKEGVSRKDVYSGRGQQGTVVSSRMRWRGAGGE